jgi:plastocyanin
MGKRAILLALTTIAIAAIAALGVAQAAPTATITVGNNFLAPANKTIGAGTKLRFKWLGGERHKIVKSRGPGGGINSPATSAKGVNLAKVLSKRGTYRFVCVFHPTEMRTRVVVVR